MDLSVFYSDLQNSGFGQWINTSATAYPIIESLHVVAIALVFGSIMVVDLRLLGLASTNRPYSKVAQDLLHLTWAGFALAVVTGVMLFLPNAVSISQNNQFWIKMGLLMLAGVNMLIMEFVTSRDVKVWDTTLTPPNAARIAGLLSLLFWAGVIVFGRLIGFTTVVEDPFAGLI